LSLEETSGKGERAELVALGGGAPNFLQKFQNGRKEVVVLGGAGFQRREAAPIGKKKKKNSRKQKKKKGRACHVFRPGRGFEPTYFSLKKKKKEGEGGGGAIH